MNANPDSQYNPTVQTENSMLFSAWGIMGSVQACPDCQSTYFISGGSVRSTCPTCLKANLESVESGNSLVDAVAPEFIIPHQIDQSRLKSTITAFSSGIPFPPEDLTAANLSTRLIPVLLPAWLVDTSVKASWTAEMGFNYQVVSHKEQFDQNAQRWLTQEIKETRVGWEPRAGVLEREYPNISAPAVENEKMFQEKLGVLNQKDAQNYQPDLLPAGMYVKLPSRIQGDAWNDALIELHRLAAEECRIAGGADFIRNFKWEPIFAKQNWTLFLRPIYSSFYLDDDRNMHRVWIQGVTGTISGKRKSSMRRAQQRAITILSIAAVIFFVGLVAAGIGLLLPPVLILGGLLLLAASVTGLGALVPIFQSWQFNKAT